MFHKIFGYYMKVKTKRKKVKTKIKKVKSRTNKTNKTNKTKKGTRWSGGFSFFNNDSSITNIVNTGNLAQQNTGKTINASKNIKIASNIGYGAVTLLSATGVGLPLAGMLGGALLISNKLANMYMDNLKLYTLMLDTMTILSNCYQLNDLINKSTEVFTVYIYTTDDEFNKVKEENFKESLNNAETLKNQDISKLKQDSESQLQLQSGGVKQDIQNNVYRFITINETAKLRVFDNLHQLIAYLLEIADDKTIDFLLQDKDIGQSGFKNKIQDEKDKRNKSKLKFIGKIKRGVERTLNSKEIMNNILDKLTVISALFITIKGQYDMIMDLYERILGDDWKKVWNYIEKTNEFKSYMFPGNILDDVNKIIKDSKEEIKEAAKISDKIDDQEEKQEQLKQEQLE